jgi:hypothetical protein
LNTRTLPHFGGEKLLIRPDYDRADVTYGASAVKQTVDFALVLKVDAAPPMTMTIQCFEDMDRLLEGCLDRRTCG